MADSRCTFTHLEVQYCELIAKIRFNRHTESYWSWPYQIHVQWDQCWCSWLEGSIHFILILQLCNRSFHGIDRIRPVEIARKVLRKVRPRQRYLEPLSNKRNISNNSIIAIIAITPIIAITRTVRSALIKWQ
jgi:hypothetical protein